VGETAPAVSLRRSRLSTAAELHLRTHLPGSSLPPSTCSTHLGAMLAGVLLSACPLLQPHLSLEQMANAVHSATLNFMSLQNLLLVCNLPGDLQGLLTSPPLGARQEGQQKGQVRLRAWHACLWFLKSCSPPSKGEVLALPLAQSSKIRGSL
jgi:hypothetical protein